MDDSYDYEDRKPKLVKGQQLRMKIEGKGAKGDFFGKKGGLVVFLRDCSTVPVGEAVDVEVVEVRERCAFAKKI